MMINTTLIVAILSFYVHQTLEELIANGYINSSYRDQADYGDGQVYSLTEKGKQYLKEEIITTDNKDY